MAIPVQCQCGRKINAPDQAAGRRLKCPDCKSAVVIPAKKRAVKKKVVKKKVVKKKVKEQPKPQSTTPATSPQTISVSCQCGAHFEAEPHLAGQTVACPKCQAALTIPAIGSQPAEAKPAPTAPINVSCQCGAWFNAEHHLAGTTVACPKCQRPLRIPNPDESDGLTAIEEEEQDDAFQMASSELDDVFTSADSIGDEPEVIVPRQTPASKTPTPQPSRFSQTKMYNADAEIEREGWSLGIWFMIIGLVLGVMAFLFMIMTAITTLVFEPMGFLVYIGMCTFYGVLLVIALIGTIVQFVRVIWSMFDREHAGVAIVCIILFPFSGLGVLVAYGAGWAFADMNEMFIWTGAIMPLMFMIPGLVMMLPT